MRKTTMQVAIIVLALAFASPTAATTVKNTNEELIVLLEDQVKVTYPIVSPLKKRLTAFFIRHKVKRPAYYASLLLEEETMTDWERKLFAAMLVPETRGDHTAVSSEGAVGPWQQHPFWFKRFGKAVHPKKNLTVCLEIYRIHRKEAGTVSRALVDYSGGSSWYPTKVKGLMREI